MANDGFNGSTANFAGSALTPLNSIAYEGVCAEIDVGGASDSTEKVAGGIPDETLTVEIAGETSVLPGATGNTVVAWFDGGTLGSFTSAVCTGVTYGGGEDGPTTSTLTFKRGV
jgi:hypothetical protein